METDEVFLVVGLGAIALIPIVVIARVFLKFLGRPIGCICVILGLPLLLVGFISSDNGMIAAAVVALALGVTLLFCNRKSKKIVMKEMVIEGGKRTKKTSKPTVKYRTIEAFVAAIELGDVTIDANIRAIFTDVASRLQSIADDIDDEAMAEKLYNKCKLVSRIAAAKVNGSKEPLIHDLDDLAILVDERRVTMDPSAKMALREVYNLVDSIELPDNDNGDIDDATLLAVTLEQILYPVGVR